MKKNIISFITPIALFSLTAIVAFAQNRAPDLALDIEIDEETGIFPKEGSIAMRVNFWKNGNVYFNRPLSGERLNPEAKKIDFYLDFSDKNGIFFPEFLKVEVFPNIIPVVINTPSFTVQPTRYSIRNGAVEKMLITFRPRESNDNTTVSIPIQWLKNSKSEGKNITKGPIKGFLVAGNRFEVKSNYIESGYSVQVASLETYPSEQFLASLSNYGRVYFNKEGKYFQIRIGTFGEEMGAKLLQKTIIKTFKDAFLVYEKGGYLGTIIDMELRTTPTSMDYISISSVVPRSLSYDLKSYSIQLGAYNQEPNLQKFRPLESFSNVYTIQEESLVKVRVGPYSNFTEVSNYLKQVHDSGFPSAFIVEEGFAPTQSYDEPASYNQVLSFDQPVGYDQQYHLVKSGETLFGIAKMYNMTVAELRALNNMGINDVLKKDQLIVIY